MKPVEAIVVCVAKWRTRRGRRYRFWSFLLSHLMEGPMAANPVGLTTELSDSMKVPHRSVFYSICYTHLL